MFYKSTLTQDSAPSSQKSIQTVLNGISDQREININRGQHPVYTHHHTLSLRNNDEICRIISLEKYLIYVLGRRLRCAY